MHTLHALVDVSGLMVRSRAPKGGILRLLPTNYMWTRKRRSEWPFAVEIAQCLACAAAAEGINKARLECVEVLVCSQAASCGQRLSHACAQRRGEAGKVQAGSSSGTSGCSKVVSGMPHSKEGCTKAFDVWAGSTQPSLVMPPVLSMLALPVALVVCIEVTLLLMAALF